jgi:type VI secretion system secreted protein Hcp
MALLIYAKIKGQKQGIFKGRGSRGAGGWIPVVSFEYEVISQRDPGSGLATGRRQHKPVTFRKEIDASSPQIFASTVENEVLTEVQFEFMRAAPDGKETLEYKVTLTNAGVASYKESVNIAEQGGPVVDTRPLDEVSLTFQRIDLESIPGKTDASDDWLATE